MDDGWIGNNTSRNAKKYEGLMQGFQLWVNLPAKKKMVDPKYRGIENKQIPIIQKNGAKFKIIAGKVDNTEGPVKDLSIDVEYLDIISCWKNI